MLRQRKKDGEKALLLHACGENLFGCLGDTRVTQGIYVQQKNDSFDCFCKRAVWVPSTNSLECLVDRFKSFDVPFPKAILADPMPVVGLCGKNPTRTAHATDCSFMLVYMSPLKRKFVVGAVATFDHSQLDDFSKPLVYLHTLSSDPKDISECIEWILKESREHDKEKMKKKPRQKKATHVPVVDDEPLPPPNIGYGECNPFDSSFGSYDEGYCCDTHRVFSEPIKMTHLKRRRMNNYVSPPPLMCERMFFSSDGVPLYNGYDGYNCFYPSASATPMHPVHPMHPVNPAPFIPYNPMFPQRRFAVAGLESDSISSPEHISTPLVSASTSIQASSELASLPSMDLNAAAEPEPEPEPQPESVPQPQPLSPYNDYPFLLPPEEESNTFFK